VTPLDANEFLDLFALTMIAKERVARWTVRPMPLGWGAYRRPVRGLTKRRKYR
jgi:hypothetical protein